MPFEEDEGRSSEMGLKMPSRDGLKDAIQNNIDFMRYSFVRVLIPVIEEDTIEECWSLFWEIEFGSFSCPLLYWGVIS